jgi:hypothetical protein
MIDPAKYEVEFAHYWEFFIGLTQRCPKTALKIVMRYAEERPVTLSGTLPCVMARLWGCHRAAVAYLPQLLD